MILINYQSTARRADIGQVAYNTDNNELYVCCTSYDHPSWLRLATLSSGNWMKHRDGVAENLEKDKHSGLELERKGKDNIGKLIGMDKTRQMLLELYDKMVPEEKKKFLKSHDGSWLVANICTVCLEPENSKIKCIHFSCGGMCTKCHDTFQASQEPEKKCPCCGESQQQICPICQEEKSQDELVKAEGGCSHSVCWQCFGRAYKSGHPINKCPLCRGPFARGPSNDIFDESDEELEETEEEALMAELAADEIPVLLDDEIRRQLEVIGQMALLDPIEDNPQQQYLSETEITEIYGALINSVDNPNPVSDVTSASQGLIAMAHPVPIIRSNREDMILLENAMR